MIIRSNPAHTPAYRPDIDGMRAVAVMLVVVFHAFPGSLRGGFVGVDIFFVISGYLISTILFVNFEQDRHSLLEFYERRIRRIFPALVTVLIATLVMGWQGLLPSAFDQLGRHVAGGAGFISNFILWGESGYFDNVAETKPLLHLWSLGVEEQFYIFYPAMLWLASKLRINLLLITLVVATISFGYNMATFRINPAGDFFSPQTRFWELMIGSTLAYANLRWSRWVPGRNVASSGAIKAGAICSFAGAIMISFAALYITRSTPYPSGWALLPTLGAALLILAGPNAPVNRWLLSTPAAIWFGKISYPLYLWHWVLLTYARIDAGTVPTPGYRLTMIALSIALAWLTYRLIEQPLRFGPRGGAKAIGLVVALAMVGLGGLVVDRQDGYPARYKDQEDFLAYFENSGPQWRYFEREKILESLRDDCNFYDLDAFRNGNASNIPRKSISDSCHRKQFSQRHTAFIWGDSHAQHLYHGLATFMPADWELLIVASSACPANPNHAVDSVDNYCSRSNFVAMQAIRKTQPDVVVVAQNIDQSPENMRVIADKLRRAGVKRVVFTGPTPHWTTDLPQIIVRDLWPDTPRRTLRGLDMNIVQADARLKSETANDPAFTYVSIIDLFCKEGGCLTYLGNDSKTGITSGDYGHLTPLASEYLAEKSLARIVFDSPNGAPSRSR